MESCWSFVHPFIHPSIRFIRSHLTVRSVSSDRGENFAMGRRTRERPPARTRARARRARTRNYSCKLGVCTRSKQACAWPRNSWNLMEIKLRFYVSVRSLTLTLSRFDGLVITLAVRLLFVSLPIPSLHIPSFPWLRGFSLQRLLFLVNRRGEAAAGEIEDTYRLDNAEPCYKQPVYRRVELLHSPSRAGLKATRIKRTLSGNSPPREISLSRKNPRRLIWLLTSASRRVASAASLFRETACTRVATPPLKIIKATQ